MNTHKNIKPLTPAPSKNEAGRVGLLRLELRPKVTPPLSVRWPKAHPTSVPYVVHCCLLISILCLLSGCAQQKSSPSEMAALDLSNDANKTEVMKITKDVLAQMQFEIEKFDPEAGYIKTRPLEGAQFFEFWRSDNAGAYNWLLSNLHSVRRTVEIILRRSQDAGYGGRSDEALAKQSSIDDKRETTDPFSVVPSPPTLPQKPELRRMNELSCTVQIQRLSMPEQQVTSSARAYAMFTRSAPGLQTLVLNPEQQRDMAWIDLGRDKELENEIIKRISSMLDARRSSLAIQYRESSIE